ncbi:helix-turn-helix domain-containing protein [Streptomyces sp. CEV 2-1]|uniref:helix-turn-helix domain-containing protein n=1 Tax=Streptomyces sp. CEV 2-1 TaxID=2485153 RepID=UPI0037D9DF8E
MRRGWCRGSAPGPAPHTLFTPRGYAATTTRSVAERAGVRQATMYHYAAGRRISWQRCWSRPSPRRPHWRGNSSRRAAGPPRKGCGGVRGGHGGCGDTDRGGAGVAEAPPRNPVPRTPEELEPAVGRTGRDSPPYAPSSASSRRGG